VPAMSLKTYPQDLLRFHLWGVDGGRQWAHLRVAGVVASGDDQAHDVVTTGKHRTREEEVALLLGDGEGLAGDHGLVCLGCLLVERTAVCWNDVTESHDDHISRYHQLCFDLGVSQALTTNQRDIGQGFPQLVDVVRSLEKSQSKSASQVWRWGMQSVMSRAQV
jgi:hypothetical protein